LGGVTATRNILLEDIESGQGLIVKPLVPELGTDAMQLRKKLFVKAVWSLWKH
jgi:hypothetical protein